MLESENIRQRFGLSLHHFGVVAADLETGSRIYRALGYRAVTEAIEDPVQGVTVQFFQLGDKTPVEIIVPGGPQSPVSSFLEKQGGGLHHLCFETSDLDGLLAYARTKRAFITRRPEPATAFEGRRIAFVYWENTLTEFVEAAGADAPIDEQTGEVG